MSTIHGRAGGSLDHAAGWAASPQAAAHGKRGEQLTAAVLARLGQHAVVFHDLSVPGSRANIDHVVVYGSKVLPIDSKCWQAGTYWTFGAQVRRGFTRLPNAEKHPHTVANLRKMLQGTRASVVDPLTVIWPSSTKAPQRLALLTLPEGRVVPGRNLEAVLVKRVHNIGKPADPLIVSRLQGYVRR